MRYSTLGGGKRLRPALVYLTGESFGAALTDLDAAAAAVELIHVYSLVHDDLPAMDDDDLRRGRPTCHRAYDEATAILVGDALQALAFSVLADDSLGTIAPATRLSMIRTLAQAAGTAGMAGGQAVDLAAVGQTLSVDAVENMHRRKTGALIKGSVLLGALGVADGDQPLLAQPSDRLVETRSLTDVDHLILAPLLQQSLHPVGVKRSAVEQAEHGEAER